MAIHEAYKGIYFDNKDWRTVTFHGLKATVSAVDKMEYLMPGYRFSFNSSSHYIHTVRKSIMRNETEVLALDVG